MHTKICVMSFHLTTKKCQSKLISKLFLNYQGPAKVSIAFSIGQQQRSVAWNIKRTVSAYSFTHDGLLCWVYLLHQVCQCCTLAYIRGITRAFPPRSSQWTWTKVKSIHLPRPLLYWRRGLFTWRTHAEDFCPCCLQLRRTHYSNFIIVQELGTNM